MYYPQDYCIHPPEYRQTDKTLRPVMTTHKWADPAKYIITLDSWSMINAKAIALWIPGFSFYELLKFLFFAHSNCDVMDPKVAVHRKNHSPSPPADGGHICKNMSPKNGIRLH